MERVRNLLCQGMTFVPLDIASILLGNSLNIADVSQTLFPIRPIGCLPFKESLYWLQFSYIVGISNATVHAFAYAMKGVLEAGVGAYIP